MKVKALKSVTGTHRIRVGEIGELPDDIAKVFIEHGCVEEVKEEKPKKKTKTDAKTDKVAGEVTEDAEE